jgi:hypothetical protein
VLTCQSVNLEKLSTHGAWLNSRPTLVLVFVFSLFCLGGPYTQIATAPLDPILATPAQDEALYSHGILRMAAGEDWLTPRFLGRPLLVKPPLLQWLSAASLKLFGNHLWVLRLPSILAAAAILTIIYHSCGPVGWILLLSTQLWRSRAGLVLMDDLLTLFYLIAILQFARDPKLSARWAGYVVGAAVGLAIMTKWFAGVLPLALFLWARPPLRRWIEATAAILIVALPWHLYQLNVNHDWFLAEYLGVELLGYAFSAPVQASRDSQLGYYLPRLVWLLPLAIPLAARRWNAAWVIWCGVLLASIFAYSYRNTTYLAPLAPALLLCHRGWIHWAFAPLALAALMSYPAPQAQPAIDNSFAGREVLHLDPDDQLRTTLLPGATVRYVFLIEHLPPNGPLDFEKLGIARSVTDFLQNPGPEVDAVLAKDLDQLRRLIEASPQRDFILSEKVWLALAIVPPHQVLAGPKVILRSRTPLAGPRPNGFSYFTGL